MKFKRVSIATARIEGLAKPPYYFKHGYYAWDILFHDSSTVSLCDLPYIKVGDTEEEGNLFYDQLKKNFNEAHINDGDKVAVILEDDAFDEGLVLAIGNIGENAWIDVTDKFVKKTFAELNIIPISLTVY